MMVQERGVAIRADVPPAEIIDRIIRFFDARLAALRRPASPASG